MGIQDFIISPILIYFGGYWGFSLLFFLLDWNLENAGTLGQYKIQGKPTVDWDKYYKAAQYVIQSQLMVSIPIFFVLYPLWMWRGEGSSSTFPEILKDLVVMALVYELLFSCSHFLFHQGSLYQRYHKVHHEWQTPVAVAGHYAHPVEHLFANMLPAILAPMITNLPTWIIHLYIVFATFRVTASHSGFKYLGAENHDTHHKRFTVNYGIFGIFDRLIGSYV